MDEIDAQGRQLLLERPPLIRGRLSVFREPAVADDWFPRLVFTIKRKGTDYVLWRWTSHNEPVSLDEPPPYGDELMLEKYFELESPVKSPRGLETVVWIGPGLTNHGRLSSFSLSLYLYPESLEERGVQLGVVDFPGGLTCASLPAYFRVNFPW